MWKTLSPRKKRRNSEIKKEPIESKESDIKRRYSADMQFKIHTKKEPEKDLTQV